MAPLSVQPGRYVVAANSITEPNDDIHIVHKRSQNNKSKNASMPNDPDKQTFVCDVCKESYPTHSGMTIHRGRHAKDANTATAINLNRRIAPLSDNPSTSQAKEAPKGSSKAIYQFRM